jgi:hypothetical protein
MSSIINITFTGTLKQGITGTLKQGILETDVINILKAFNFYYSSYIFEPGVKSFYQIDNRDVIPVNDTKISFKSLVPKDNNGPVDIIAEKEWQLAYPNNDTIECITNGTFKGQYRIERNMLELIKITRNKRSGKIKEKIVYQSVSADGYLYYNLGSDNGPMKKQYNIYANRLFGMVFNNNDDIFRNTDCDHIVRFRW